MSSPGRPLDETRLGRGCAGEIRLDNNEARGLPALKTWYYHALGDFEGEEVGKFLSGPRCRRIGLRCEEVSAEVFLGSHARRGNDVNSRCARERLEEGKITTVEHAGGINDRSAAGTLEGPKFCREGVEDVDLIEGDVEGVLCAGHNREERFVNGDDTELVDRDGAENGVHGGRRENLCV